MRAALAFLTSIGGARTPSSTAFRWFPVVGAGLGLALGGLWWGADRLWPPAVAAALVVVADLGLTGALHLDGLVDSADGMLSHVPPERRLEVMATPDVGAFGLAAGASALLLRFAALAALRPAPLLLAGLWCGSRTAMALVALALPYARAEGGLADAFLGDRAAPIGVAGLATAALLAGLWRVGPGLAAVAALAVAAAAVAALGRRRLGGFTGDVLGACGLVGETAGLLVAAARW